QFLLHCSPLSRKAHWSSAIFDCGTPACPIQPTRSGSCWQ
ncbi:phytanoyl-CoA dioxygenase family protein, partial [Cryptococcus neoformans MW-RSA852]